MQSLLKAVCALSFLFCSFGLLAQNESADTLSAAEKLFEEASALEAEQKFEDAIMKYDSASTAFLETGMIDRFEKCNEAIHKLCLLHKPETRFEYYEQKVKFCKDSFGEKSPQTGLWYRGLGELYSGLRQYDLAKEYTIKALEIFRSHGEKENQEFLCMYSLGLIAFESANYKESEITFKKCFDLLDTALEKGQISKENFIENLANLNESLGAIMTNTANPKQAVLYHEAALELKLEINNEAELASSYFNIGQLYMTLGDYNRAKEYIQKSIFYIDKFYGADFYMAGICYATLGTVSSEMRDFEEAIDYYRKSLDICKRSLGDEHMLVAQIYSRFGEIYTGLKQYDKSEEIFRKSYNILKKMPNPDPEKSIAMSNLAVAWANQNIKLDSALLLLNKSLNDNITVYGEHHPIIAETYGYIRSVYNKQKDYENALITAQNELITNSYEFNNPDVSKNPDPSDFMSFSLGLFTLSAKSFFLHKIWEQDKDNQSLIEPIVSCSNLTDAMITDYVKNLGEQVIQNPNFKRDLLEVAATVIGQNLDFYEHTKNPEFMEDYFFWMEKIKAQELLLASQASKAFSFAGISSELIAKDKAFAYEIDSLEQLLFAARQNDDSIAVKTIQNESLFEVKRNREAFMADLEKNYPDYYQLKYDFEPVGLKDLKGHIKENALYLELSVEEYEGQGNLFFLVLTNQDEQIFKTDLIPDLSKKITTLNKLLRSHNLLRADRRRKFINLSHELYNQFIQPVEHLLEGKDQLVIVGEGVTHYLPFEVLLKSNEDKPWNELDFLIRDHEVSYHYSGTLFTRAQASEKEFENELLAFAPVFSESDNTLAALREGGLVMTDSTFRSVEGDNFSPLPHSEKEVKNIRQLFPESSKVNVLLNENADETNLKSKLEQNHRFVHIASHSFANIDHPNFSGIACSESDSGNTKDDGILYVGEIYNLAVNSDLVVLSSCESGVGKLSGGEGMLGLNRSFVYAGVPNVIFSLWKVYDEATGKMMTEFYRKTLNGDSYSKALRTAKLKMLENPTTATPDIWGAFLLVGR